MDRVGKLLTAASALTILLGGPMLVSPLMWAQTLGWNVPADTELAVYFGRCLGLMVVSMGIMGFAAARTPKVRPFYFNFVLTAIGINILVHIWGAIRHIQPVSETIEIVGWVLLFAMGLIFYPKE